MAVPKLRFKEFDGDWIKSKLGSEAQFFQGEQVSLDDQCSEYAHGLIKFLRIENFTQKSKDFRYIRYTGSQEKILGEQDIAIVRYGATAGFICSGETGVIANNLFKVSVDNKKINQKYLELVLKSEKTFTYFQAEMSGGAMPALNFKIVGNLDITYSSIQEQTKIASFLSNVDEKISQLTQKHELLSQYKQGMMQKLFSQQIRFKADDGSEFGEWRKAKVGNITETIFGYPFDSKEMVEDNNGIPLMRGINIGECHIRHSFELDRFFLKDTSKLEKYFVRVNDIVLSMDGSKVGRNSAFVTEKDAGSLLVQRVCILREKENTNIQYVYQWIISKEFHRYVDQVKTSSGIPHISGKQIQDYEISYPCLEEQTKIANFLSAIDQKIGVVAQQIEHAKQWKKGLLQQMFV